MADIKLDDYEGGDHDEDLDLTSGGEEPRVQMAAVRAAPSRWFKSQQKREWLAQHALYLANNRSRIHYRQFRPVNVSKPLTVAATDDIYLDCSSMVQWLYARANVNFKRTGGMVDPSNLGHSGYGNTWSQESHGARVGTPKKGDLAFYNGHVAIVVRPNPQNPRASLVVSHGSEPGPLILRANYRSDLHSGFRRYFR